MFFEPLHPKERRCRLPINQIRNEKCIAIQLPASRSDCHRCAYITELLDNEATTGKDMEVGDLNGNGRLALTLDPSPRSARYTPFKKRGHSALRSTRNLRFQLGPSLLKCACANSWLCPERGRGLFAGLDSDRLFGC